MVTALTPALRRGLTLPGGRVMSFRQSIRLSPSLTFLVRRLQAGWEAVVGVFAKARNLGLLKAPVLGTPTGERLATTEDQRERDEPGASVNTKGSAS